MLTCSIRGLTTSCMAEADSASPLAAASDSAKVPTAAAAAALLLPPAAGRANTAAGVCSKRLAVNASGTSRRQPNGGMSCGTQHDAHDLHGHHVSAWQRHELSCMNQKQK